jgi:hypothetical protein
MNADAFLRQFRDDLQANSPYEVVFVERVLSRVPDLDFRNVSIQTAFTDDTGRQRRIDFTIVEGPRVRLALEVDGYNKDGVNPGMSHEQFVDWQRRERAITRRGWTLLRFANRELNRDPAGCAEAIQVTLKRLRDEAEAYRKAEEAQRLHQRISTLQSELLAAQDRAKRAEQQVSAAESEARLAAERVRTLQEGHRRSSGQHAAAHEAAMQAACEELIRAQSALDEQTKDLQRLRETVTDSARRAGGIASTQRDQAVIASHRSAWQEFESELRAAVEGELSPAEERALRERAQSEAEDAERAARAALRKLERENSQMKVMSVVLGGVVMAAIGVLGFLAWDARSTDSAAPLTPAERVDDPTPTVRPEVAQLRLVRLSSPVRPGDDASLAVSGSPGTECTIAYTTPSGSVSSAAGLVPATLDNRGEASWTWRIGSNTAPGEGSVEVRCGSERLLETFSIRE